MPELPEVETLKRELAKVLIGKKIKTVTVSWPKTISPLTPRKFSERLTGVKIENVERRAKVLICRLSNGDFLLTHLKMTGQLIFKPKSGKMIIGGHPEDPTKYTRLIFDFTDHSQLYFNDLRKFGWMKLVDSSQAEKILGVHGVEPLSREFTLQKFIEILNRYPDRKIKQLLLDQTLIAGLGNIYVDEACFLARVLPTRQVKTLKPKEKSDLHRAIISVLKLSIAKKGTSARNYRRADGSQGGFVPYLQVYGRAKLPCKRCGAPITKIKLNGRGTHYCPNCQR